MEQEKNHQNVNRDSQNVYIMGSLGFCGKWILPIQRLSKLLLMLVRLEPFHWNLSKKTEKRALPLGLSLTDRALGFKRKEAAGQWGGGSPIGLSWPHTQGKCPSGLACTGGHLSHTHVIAGGTEAEKRKAPGLSHTGWRMDQDKHPGFPNRRPSALPVPLHPVVKRKMKEHSSQEPPGSVYALRFPDLIQKQNVNLSIQHTLSIHCTPSTLWGPVRWRWVSS